MNAGNYENLLINNSKGTQAGEQQLAVEFTQQCEMARQAQRRLRTPGRNNDHNCHHLNLEQHESKQTWRPHQNQIVLTS